MLIAIRVPTFAAPFAAATVRVVHAVEGVGLVAGAAVFDVSVDFSGAVAYDCPPISDYRIAMRERGWLRRVLVKKGDEIAPGALMALVTTEADESLDGPPVREARVTLASVLVHEGWWDEEP